MGIVTLEFGEDLDDPALQEGEDVQCSLEPNQAQPLF
jgi:hypothetical protein